MSLVICHACTVVTGVKIAKQKTRFLLCFRRHWRRAFPSGLRPVSLDATLASVHAAPAATGHPALRHRFLSAGLAAEAERLAGNLVEGALLEVACDPKPGLVSASGNGVHADMNLRTFMTGAMALLTPFTRSVRAGLVHRGEAADLFAALRAQGPGWESALLRATGGVNTHRGLLFTGCLVAAAAGSLLGRGQTPEARSVCRCVGALARGLCARDFSRGGLRTHGERLFRKYGAPGIRGEVEAGLPAVQRGLPALRTALDAGLPVNLALLHALIHIAPEMEDTTVLHRAGPRGLAWLQDATRRLRADGGLLEPSGLRAWSGLCAEAVRRRVSPGGCADMLALCAGLYLFTEKHWPTPVL